MPQLEALIEEVLRQRPDMDRATLLEMVAEKRRRVGAGYLTDQGSLFLVAADLGVSLEGVAGSSMTLRDLHVGATSVSVVGRVMALYPLREYRRRDGSTGAYRRLVVFDRDAAASVTLWDEKASLVDELGLRVDSVVRVVDGYARAGLDGEPTLHVGERGSLEAESGGEAEEALPRIEQVTRDVSQVRAAQKHLCVKGTLTSPAKVLEFTRRDGTPGRVSQLHLTGSGGRPVRVAIWGGDPEPLLRIPLNSTVRLVNVRSKPLPHGEVELHGDEGSAAMVLAGPASPTAKLGGYGTFRLLSVGEPRPGRNGVAMSNALVADASGEFYRLVARGDAHTKLMNIDLESMIDCSFRRLDAKTLICEHEAAIHLKAEDDPAYPRLEDLRGKVKDLASLQRPAVLEVIALSRASTQDVTTRDGSTVRRGELLVGDETGEVRVVAWRNLADMLTDTAPGERLRLSCVEAAVGRDNVPVVRLKPYSKVVRLS